MSNTPRTDAIQKSACDDTGRLCRPELLWSGLEQFELELTAAREEIRVLRLFGNNGCTAMADEYLTNKKDEK